MKKLYVGNIPFSMGEEALKSLFNKSGEVVSARIVFDKFTGKSKGYGFIEMRDPSVASATCTQLNGFSIEGRTLTVAIARLGPTPGVPGEEVALSSSKPSSHHAYRTPMPHGMVGIGDRVAALRQREEKS